jgi:mannitol-specific phosphotransferase system IIBC component
MTLITHYLLMVPVIMGGATIIGLLGGKAAKDLIPDKKVRTGLQMTVALLSPAIVAMLLMTTKRC